MSNNLQRATRLILMVGLFVLQASPAFAQFTGTGAQATSWVVQLLTPVVPLTVGVVGILCFAGRINWPWFLGALVGTALFFGRDQVVSMFRGWVGA